MIPIVTSRAMAAADRRTIRRIGLPGLVLMETAARAVADLVDERWAGASRIAVLAGGGNNGGDGIAIARILRARGHDVDLRLVVPPERLRGDAARQLGIARRLGLEPTGPGLARPKPPTGATVVVDALLGTGLDRPAAGPFLAAIREIAAARRTGSAVVSVDLPSGLDGSSGQPPGEHVEADLTVTFAALKWAHLLAPAARACGEVVVGDIGIDDGEVEAAAAPSLGPFGRLFDAAALELALPPRDRGAHKGDFGHLLLVAGGRGQAGAAILAARGALRGGAGLVTVAASEGIVPILQAAVPEAMAVALPEGSDGRPTAAAAERLAAAMSGKSGVAIGPGLGTGPGSASLVAASMAFPGPLVLDADALNLVAAGRVNLRRPAGAATVLTPHPGEAARLLGLTGSAAVQRDRPAAALGLARRTGAVALLKGEGSLVADAGGRLAFVAAGTPAMATGGSGDVLCGLVGTFVARGLDPMEATAAAAFVHGLAGERSAAERGEEGTVAGDLPDAVAATLRECGR